MTFARDAGKCTSGSRQSLGTDALETLGQYADRLAGLDGWRRSLAALLLGAASVLAMPPFHLWPVLWLTLPGLVVLLDGIVAKSTPRAWRQAVVTGWWFGFGYFLLGLYWVGSAFLVEADKFAWLLPFAVMLLPAGLALFFALATGLASYWWQPGPTRVLVLAVSLASTEWLRGHILTGFPWNALGYALTATDAMMQSAAVIGVHGLTFWTVLIFASAVLVLAPRRTWRAVPVALALLLGLATLAGAWRLPNGAAPVMPEISMRLVQPNTPEKDKFIRERQLDIFNRLLALSQIGETGDAGSLGSVRVVIWPETPVNVLLLESPDGLRMIADTLPDRTMLITGAMRRESVPPQGLTVSQQQVFNSLVAFDGDGQVAGLFDKMHLVPFGEYLPFQPVMYAVGIQELVGIHGGFGTGAGPRLMRLPGLPEFSPLICYEAIFPGGVIDPADRPRWLLNITNDAWFGVTSGPYQHFHQSRLRAVEQGLPLVRVAGTGISAVIDPFGRVVRALPLEVSGAIDAPLPQALPPTIYAAYGDLGLAMLLVLAIIVVPIGRRSGY